MTSEFRATSKEKARPGIHRQPPWRNWVTLVGMFGTVVSLMLLLTFALFTLVSPASNPYVDIIGYLVLPGGLMIGILLMLVGILLRTWRLRRLDPSRKLEIHLPRIDLNDPDQRKVVKVLAISIFLLLPIIGVSGYHGYHYTDSTSFCANACHSVMRPEAVTYSNSSHARVSCAECHIGAGASWFVRSKLSGTRQVFATMFETYNRPIPTAIQHLRPARDTCGQCHWPQKFFGAQLRQRAHFGYEEDNPRRDIRLLVKTGGADQRTGRAEGIHLHMLQLAELEYVAIDDKLQVIPWVKWIKHDGKTRIYRSDGLTSGDPQPDGKLRRMDCMDCHNRPAHEFVPPDRAVNERLAIGSIDPTLPFIKREGVAILDAGFREDSVADTDIANHISGFYQQNYPDVYARQKQSIDRAIDELQQVYREIIFPRMRVNWQTYPDNIGHLNSPGCFRCHDGKHVDDSGNAIRSDCIICHDFLNPVTSESGATLMQQGNFNHSFPLEGRHAVIRCDECHTGGTGLSPSCKGCHHEVQGLMNATLSELIRFDIEPDVMAGSVECQDCHDLTAPLNVDTMNDVCIDCHDEDYDGMLADWHDSITTRRAAALEQIQRIRTLTADPTTLAAGQLAQWLRANEPVVKLLSEPTALHNPEAATRILQTLSKEAEALANDPTSDVPIDP